jgi:FMN phosphatase YigB (HAD superfamily)
MAIDAVLANMDDVWSTKDDDQDSEGGYERSVALKQLLQRLRDDGYPLLLISDLSAEYLNSAIGSTLGQDGVTYFSAILSSQNSSDRYAVALHTLETAPHRVIALGSSEREFQEARTFGIARCVHLNDALRQIPL